jgi:hypothetical protein
MFAVEIGAPVLLLLGPPLSWAGAMAIVTLMVAIEATGNYGFFNLQTIALCVLVFDDAALSGAHAPDEALVVAPAAWRAAVTLGALASLALSAVTVVRLFARDVGVPPPVQRLFRALAPYRIVSSYGLFAIMTTSRPEILVEGSDDGEEWRAYEFRYKAIDPAAPPRTVAPHQPRLDWQMWFAALGNVAGNAWFLAFLARLLEGSRDVLGLLACDPFAGRPPRYVRAMLYDYRFTTPAERRATGKWWRRELIGTYCPAVTLDDVREYSSRPFP